VAPCLIQAQIIELGDRSLNKEDFILYWKHPS
jgi:hypothetical protein